MKFKTNLKTVRLNAIELALIDDYLKDHPYIKGFSTLVRAAVFEYLRNVAPAPKKEVVPSFLWEYDLTHAEIDQILKGPQKNRLWLVAKILEQGKWAEIWEYLELPTIIADLPLLRLTDHTRKNWEDALSLWKKKTA